MLFVVYVFNSSLEHFKCNSLYRGPKLLEYDVLPLDILMIIYCYSLKTQRSIEVVILTNNLSLFTSYSNVNKVKTVTFLVFVFNYSSTSYAHLSPHKDTGIVY